jgi:hypothetical protein
MDHSSQCIKINDPSVGMLKILFITSINTQFTHLLGLAKSLQHEGGVKCIFFFDPFGHDATEVKKKCLAEGFHYYDCVMVDSATNSSKIAENCRRQQGLTSGFIRRIIRGAAIRFFSLILNILRAWSSSRVADQVMINVVPQCIITAEDTGYISPFFVKAAKKRGIPSIVCPFSMANHEELAGTRSKHGKFKVRWFSIVKKVFLAAFPKWARETPDGRILCNDWSVALSLEIFKVAPQNPWQITGGNSDFVFVESDFVRNYYIRSGTNRNKIRLTGSPLSFVPLSGHEHNNTKEELAKDLNIDRKKKWVLLALPPDYINSRIFQSHYDMTMFLIEAMQHEEVVLLVSLHPRTSNHDVKMINWSDRIVRVSHPIEKIIPDCDIFVASCSATIRYALAARKPVINFDIFGLGYTEYDSIPMVIKVDSPEHFKNTYNELIEDKIYLQSLISRYTEYTDDYFSGGLFRFQDLLENIIQAGSGLL